VPGVGAEVKETTMPGRTKRQYTPAEERAAYTAVEALAAHAAAAKQTADAIYKQPPKRYAVARVKLVKRLQTLADDMGTINVQMTSPKEWEGRVSDWIEDLDDVIFDMHTEKD
jgi:hypothetical protein